MYRIALFMILFTFGCNTSREFWRFVVEDEATVDLVKYREGNIDQIEVESPNKVEVLYNDGHSLTRVLIPILSSGQQIYLDHQKTASIESIPVLAPPPTESDIQLEAIYKDSGYIVNSKAQPVSIIKIHHLIKKHVQDGNIGIALQYVDSLLKRYPFHVKSLQTKGSLHLKMGDREAALKAYEKAQEFEPSKKVERQIRIIESTME